MKVGCVKHKNGCVLILEPNMKKKLNMQVTNKGGFLGTGGLNKYPKTGVLLEQKIRKKIKAWKQVCVY